MSSDDFENVERGCVALVQLTLDLAGAGDVGTAERVARDALRLLDAHLAAAREVRRAAFRRASIRARVMDEGLRSDAVTAGTERRADDEEFAPMVPALRSVLRMVAEAHLRGELGRFQVIDNLLRPMLGATTEADGALAALPLAAPLSDRSAERAVELTELLRSVGVRALEVRASKAFNLVLHELDRLAADKKWADHAVETTSFLAATAARFAGPEAQQATARIVSQVALVTRTSTAASLVRRRALWRIGAAALAVGTMSVAVTVARLLATTGDLDAVVTDAGEASVLDSEELNSSLYGGYLGYTAQDAVANYGTFLSQVADLVRP